MGINVQMSNNNTVIVSGNRVVINGEELPVAPGRGSNVTTINNKVYINGYEWKKGKWQRTIRALWHIWF